MDPTVLVANLTTFLIPYLPYLLKVTENAAESLGSKLGEDSWEQAKLVWNKLWPQFQNKPSAQEAARELANDPTNNDVQAEFRVQLLKIVKSDPTLSTELVRITEGEVIQRVIAEQGSQISSVSQDASGGGSTHQEVKAAGTSGVKGVKQTRR